MLEFEQRLKDLSALEEAEVRINRVGNDALQQLDAYVIDCQEDIRKLCARKQKRFRYLTTKLKKAIQQHRVRNQKMETETENRRGTTIKQYQDFKGESYYQLNFGMVKASTREQQEVSQRLNRSVGKEKGDPASLTLDEEEKERISSQLGGQVSQRDENQSDGESTNQRQNDHLMEAKVTDKKQVLFEGLQDQADHSEVSQNESKKTVGKQDCSSDISDQSEQQAEENSNSPSQNSQPLQNEVEVLSQHQQRMISYLQVTEQINHKQAKQFIEKTRPNLKTCNMILYVNVLANLKTKNFSRGIECLRVEWRKYYFCGNCSLVCRKSNRKLFIKHLKRQHKIHNYKRILMSVFFNDCLLEQKSKVFRQQIVIRKCNCSKINFISDADYIGHMRDHHGGNPPPYCTHRINDDCTLSINQEFDQIAALEEQMTPQIYFCGLCPRASLKNCRDLLYHFENVHKDKPTFHPASSHFYTANEEADQLLSLEEHLKFNIAITKKCQKSK